MEKYITKAENNYNKYYYNNKFIKVYNIKY